MELQEMYLDPVTLEMLRKAWRGSSMIKTGKHERPFVEVGGLVNED